MIGDLLEFKPFNFESGSVHENFATIKPSPSRYIKIVEHHVWLNTHIKQLSGPIQVILECNFEHYTVND